MAREALAACSDSFMPVVNGYAFRTAGIVDLERGHAESGQEELAQAIAAFEAGAGSVGVGQAALCWIDLSRFHFAHGDEVAARMAADAATALAHTTGDPWVVAQAAENAAVLDGVS
jgi:hypothetical protein